MLRRRHHHGMTRSSSHCLCALALAAASLPAAAVTVDGRIDPAEWAQARHVTDFVRVQPLDGGQPALSTEAWLMATPRGLAVAFRAEQPPGVPRTTQRTRRDQGGPLDRVNLMVLSKHFAFMIFATEMFPLTLFGGLKAGLSVAQATIVAVGVMAITQGLLYFLFRGDMPTP